MRSVEEYGFGDWCFREGENRRRRGCSALGAAGELMEKVFEDRLWSRGFREGGFVRLVVAVLEEGGG